MAELTSEELKRMLTEILQPNGPANSAAPTPAPGATPAAAPAPASGILTTLIEKLDALITAITGSKTAAELSKASQTALAVTGLKDASNLASKAINDLAGSVPGFGRALKAAGVDLNEYLLTAQKGTQIGVGQGNASELQERALKAGFKNVQEYLDYLKDNYNNSMRTIGKSAEDSSQKLGLVQKQVVNSEEGQNLIKRGIMTPDQLAKIAGIAAEGKSQMLQSAEGRKQLAEEAARLALSIEAQTKITGESTEKILADNRARAESAEEQLRLQALTNDNQRLQYSQNQQLLATQGKSMQDLTAQIYAGGRLSKEQQQLLQAATGGRGGQYIQLIREQKRTSGLAAEDPRRVEADKRLADFVAKMSAYQASPEFARRNITTSNEGQRAAGLTLQRENKEKGAIKAIMTESQVTPEEARRRAIELARQQGRGFRQESLYDKEQVPNVGARPFEVLSEANEQARKTVAAVATEINKMTTAVGNATTALDGLREKMNVLAGPVGQTSEQRDEMIRSFIHGAPGSTGAPEGTDRSTGRPLTVTTPAVNVNATNVNVQPATTTPPATTATPPATTPVPETSRGKGTYGETGATAEIKDVVAQLHKGETVLTPDQRETMIKDSANAMFDKILGKKNNKDSTDQNVQYKNVDKNDPEFVKMRQDNAAERADRAEFMRSREVADPMYAGGKRFETYDIREEVAKLKDPAQIKTPTIDTSFAGQAESMLESQTQGVFGNLRTAFANRQQQTSPNLSDEFKNYQPKAATVTPAAPAPIQPEQPRFEARENVTIKDLNDQLMMLNKSIAQLVQTSSATTNFAEQQIRVTKKLSGNRFG